MAPKTPMTGPGHPLPRRALLQAGAFGALAAATALGSENPADPRANPAVEEDCDCEADVAARPGREVWIASLTLEGIQGSGRDETIRQVLARMEQVSGVKPDLICLPETFNSRFTPRPTTASQVAEPLDGPTLTALGAFAKAKKCYVVAPITLDRGGGLFNTAVLIDRAGRVLGAYDKIHPTENELRRGITPGRDGARVFTTDFGKLGIQICFDIDWPDGWQMLKDRGAELVVWPAAYPGGFPLNALAWTHRYPIVTSPWTSPAALIDVDGHTLATSGTWEPWIATAFHLDRGLFHLDFHLSKLRELEKAHGRGIRVRWSHDENAFVLENRVPGKTLAALASEFGLTPMDTYLARAKSAQDRIRG
jgi:beta-ureidopropionase